jgi:hypothetical protein
MVSLFFPVCDKPRRAPDTHACRKNVPKNKVSTAKGPRDDTGKELFEMGEWARNDVTMERVGKSVRVYSYAKDGQSSRGERADDKTSIIASGQTIRVILHDFM